ncbi:MAG: hypothetical protein ACM3JG_02290 [Thiohalocapsa sp.]
MARTALTELQEQIEAVRREAFAAGYAAAMQSIREFVAKPAPGAQPPPTPTRRRRMATATAAQPAAGRRGGRRRAAVPASVGGRGRGQRPQRGTNARLVEEVLQSNSPRALHPAEIRSALQRDKGVSMAFTSIRHALTQLEGRHTAEQVADSRTWRYCGSGNAAASAEATAG